MQIRKSAPGSDYLLRSCHKRKKERRILVKLDRFEKNIRRAQICIHFEKNWSKINRKNFNYSEWKSLGESLHSPFKLKLTRTHYLCILILIGYVSYVITEILIMYLTYWTKTKCMRHIHLAILQTTICLLNQLQTIRTIIISILLPSREMSATLIQNFTKNHPWTINLTHTHKKIKHS